MSTNWRRITSTIAAALAAGLPWVGCESAKAAASVSGSAGRTAVRLRDSGDDVLTQRFVQAVVGALRSSQQFTLTSDPGDEELRLEIPTHVYWTHAQGRTNFQYVVILTNQDSKYLGISIGSCWEEDVAECAQEVLRDASAAWSRRYEPDSWSE